MEDRICPTPGKEKHALAVSDTWRALQLGAQSSREVRLGLAVGSCDKGQPQGDNSASPE